MKRLSKIIGVICFAIAAFQGLLSSSLPFEFVAAGLFFFFLPDVV